jgi:methyl-accepting chemotaxis protein
VNEQFELPVKMRDYDTVLIACESLGNALQKLVPLARKMHLLSSNAVCSAARAGSEGDAFRVLTQDIRYLSEDVSSCIGNTQLMMDKSVLLAANLVSVLSRSSFVGDNATTDEKKAQIQLIHEKNCELTRLLHQLDLALSPVEMLAKKGEYLAVFSSVEAANSGEHRLSFEAVASMLKTLVKELNMQSKQQKRLLSDLIESVEKRQFVLKIAVKAA